MRVLQAYLLTYLTAAEAAVRVGLSEPVVTVFGELFFAVRGSSPLATLLRAEAGWADDRLWRMAAAGVAAVHAAALWEAGGDGLSPEWAERFERADLLDRLFEANPAAYIRAVDRLRAIEERFRPTVRRC